MSDALAQALGYRAPRSLDRMGRVSLLAEVAAKLLRGTSEAELFVGSALSAWLEHGGSLEKKYLRVAAQRGSHRTAAALYSAHRDDDAAARNSLDSVGINDEGST